MESSPLTSELTGRKPVYSVITNCTYDGLCYNATAAQELLEKSCDRIHFDEAWYGYARFNPMYEGHFAMRGDPATHKGATIFATHSTHKLLAALSQASYIHIRDGRGAIDHQRFNQAYMMHTTTSPLYPIVASNDIASAMMDGRAGYSLTQEVIREAVDFRQTVGRIRRKFQEKNDWFFKPWNAETVADPKTGRKIAFEDAPAEMLCTQQDPWMMHPDDSWHGFEGMAPNWCMLDPVKVSILAPGMGDDGQVEKTGVPAALVNAFFTRFGIVPTRVTDFQIMFLFSIGITKGKWGTLDHEPAFLQTPLRREQQGRGCTARACRAASRTLPQNRVARPWRRDARIHQGQPPRRALEPRVRDTAGPGPDATERRTRASLQTTWNTSLSRRSHIARRPMASCPIRRVSPC